MKRQIREPTKDPCMECAKYKICSLEHRGICKDFKKKETRTIRNE